MAIKACRCGESMLRHPDGPAPEIAFCRHCDRVCRVPYSLCGPCRAVNSRASATPAERPDGSLLETMARCAACGWTGHIYAAAMPDARDLVALEYAQHLSCCPGPVSRR